MSSALHHGPGPGSPVQPFHFWSLLLFLSAATAILPSVRAADDGHHGIIEEEDDVEPAIAVLFPWFSQVLGVVTFFLLTRYLHALPYTAVMFLLGTFMGAGAVWNDHNADELKESIALWSQIDGEVLLLVFLPGLLFKDAFDVNFHLFRASIGQLVIMAFPMVLAGTVLAALVGYYIFPYDWSWPLSLAFGSILAATDPVAVSALLNEVGAPPRLKMHVSGESMLNDGSAVVFYTIFSSMFLSELEIEGVGDDVNWGEGFAKFFRMSLGGAAIGVAFAFGLMLLLFMLNRRLDHEENVLQVAATVTVAYLSFYVAEVPCKCSGVISVVVCGITSRAFGSNMINDQHMMESFWILVEHLLNTLLFALGGVVWGAVLAEDTDQGGVPLLFDATDWGYLILLYVLLTVIRFLLVLVFYPLISRIGLRSNWREAVFLSYGGLRGAVGIALALSLNSEVFHATEVGDKSFDHRQYTTKLFGMVGGVAFFTLVINGTTSGPLLRKLGLAKPTKARAGIVKHFAISAKDYIVDDFVHLLADPRFKKVDFAVIRHHVPVLRSLTADELKLAVRKNKENVPASQYKAPYLENVLPYLEEKESTIDTKCDSEQGMPYVTFKGITRRKSDEEHPTSQRAPTNVQVNNNSGLMPAEDKDLLLELRSTFIELLRSAYQKQVEKGELDGRGFLHYVLFQSLEFAADTVAQGGPLNDWEATQIVGGAWTSRIENSITSLYSLDCKHGAEVRAISPEYLQLRLDVKRALAFIAAHQVAQEHFEAEFVQTAGKVSATEVLVLSESQAQVRVAEDTLKLHDHRDVEVVISHLACKILLNKGARWLENLANMGLLKPREAHFYIEKCEHALDEMKYCSRWKHPGELSKDEKLSKMSQKSFNRGRKHLQCDFSNEDDEDITEESLKTIANTERSSATNHSA